MTMMLFFPAEAEVPFQVDSFLSPEVLAVVQEADLVALAAAEVSVVVALLAVGKILRDKVKVKGAKVRIHL